MKIISKTATLGVLLLLINLGNLAAQEIEISEPTNNKWTFLVVPYIMFPNMKGTIGLGNLPNAEIDASTNDILGNLKMGFMLNLEVTNGIWAVGSDVLYMKLGTEKVRSRDID